MKWASMKKEQKQKAILGAMGAVIVVFVLLRFGAAPMVTSRGVAVAERKELVAKIEAASQAIRGEKDLETRRDSISAALAVACSDYVPPAENPLSWATKLVYGHARSVGVDIESVAEVDARTGLWEGKEQAHRAFKPYAVRIIAQCTYRQLLQLLGDLERGNASLCVTGLSITSRAGFPESHQISLIVEWPTWKNPDKLPVPCAKRRDSNA
jgi:hypothetical protein